MRMNLPPRCRTSTAWLIVCAMALGVSSIQADAPALDNHDPEAAQLVTSDIDAFWNVFDRRDSEDLTSALQRDYLDAGSAGLKAFNTLRIGGADSLAATVRKRPEYYASLRAPSQQVAAYSDQIRAAFHRLKSLYPSALFPDVYFLIGAMNSGGTLTGSMLLIGVDMHGRSATAPLHELGEWERAVIKPIDEIPYIVAHELIHFQQHYPGSDDSLLAQAIQEGAADFVAERIAGRHINAHLHAYGDPREQALWEEFAGEMHGNDLSHWLYQGSKSTDRPADLGYYIGYRICAAYARAMPDERTAIQGILNIDDFAAFLEASGYARSLGASADTAQETADDQAPR